MDDKLPFFHLLPNLALFFLGLVSFGASAAAM
jgi:hypothetical protein